LAKPWTNSLLICLALAAAVLAVFYPALGNRFTGYDDGEYVVDNVHVRTGVSGANVAWALTAAHSNNWHPLTWISHGWTHCVRAESRGHHLTSLRLYRHHRAAVPLAERRYRRNGAAPLSRWVSDHPVHVESVAWVAERKDALSTFGCLPRWRHTSYTKPGLVRHLVVAVMRRQG
jgi:hypothetical protein